MNDEEAGNGWPMGRDCHMVSMFDSDDNLYYNTSEVREERSLDENTEKGLKKGKEKLRFDDPAENQIWSVASQQHIEIAAKSNWLFLNICRCIYLYSMYQTSFSDAKII